MRTDRNDESESLFAVLRTRLKNVSSRIKLAATYNGSGPFYSGSAVQLFKCMTPRDCAKYTCVPKVCVLRQYRFDKDVCNQRRTDLMIQDTHVQPATRQLVLRRPRPRLQITHTLQTLHCKLGSRVYDFLRFLHVLAANKSNNGHLLKKAAHS